MNPSNLTPAELTHQHVKTWHTTYWTELQQRIHPTFNRADARSRALSYISGLLSPAERKNSWQLAEISGNPNPYGFQHLLGRASWDANTLGDQLRTYITDHLHDAQAIGVLDETGFLKKGRHSTGVIRQYSGTAGRVENCQIGVFLNYASRHGHTLLDRELYLPAEWTNDPDRCQQAGVPDNQAFATKPALARTMLERTFTAGINLAWVTGDSVYGNDRKLRQWLEDRQQPYVMAVSGKETVWYQKRQRSVKSILAALPTKGWKRISAGVGSKGPRLYDWWRINLASPAAAGWRRWLLVRRSIVDSSEVTAIIVYAPTRSTLADQVRVAGMRWTIEESLQTSKGEVGLDHYEVRSWTGWYRHVTLAMWAQAFLSVLRMETQTLETQAVVSAKKKQLNRKVPGQSVTSSLAVFKAHRGLQSA
jgi:SRSO17 transposase